MRRWTRRDRLAIIVIAVTIAFFTGATVITTAVARQTTQLAAGYGPIAYLHHGHGPTTLAVADLTTHDTYVGPPRTSLLANMSLVWPGPSQEFLGTLDSIRTLSLHRTAHTQIVRVQPRTPGMVLPADWYAGSGSWRARSAPRPPSLSSPRPTSRPGVECP